jgi:hypothetical protein
MLPNKYISDFVLSQTKTLQSMCPGPPFIYQVAPIEIHEEDLLDVEEQLRLVFHWVKDSVLDVIPLLKGSFSNWIWTRHGIPVSKPFSSLGIFLFSSWEYLCKGCCETCFDLYIKRLNFFLLPVHQPSSIFPSVKCGLEMAILNLLASQCKCSWSEFFTRSKPLLRDGNMVEYNQSRSASVQICALVDCNNGTPIEVALTVFKLVAQGFTTIKLKVTCSIIINYHKIDSWKFLSLISLLLDTQLSSYTKIFPQILFQRLGVAKPPLKMQLYFKK